MMKTIARGYIWEMKVLENVCIQKGSKRYRQAIVALFLGSIIAFGAEYCVQPIIPVIAATFDLQPTEASLAVSCGTGGMAIAMLLLAVFAKRMARKMTMTIALVGAALLTLGIAATESFGLILLFRFFQGILLAGFPVMAIAYVNEEFEPKIVGSIIGIYVAGTSLGGLAGRIILSTLTDFFSWQTSLAVMGLVYAVVGIFFWLFLPAAQQKIAESVQPNVIKDLKRLLGNKQLLGVYAIAFAVMGAFVCMYNFISYVLLAAPYNLSQTAIGFIFTIYLVGTVASGVMGRLCDRLGSGKVLTMAILCMLTGNLLTLFTLLALKILGLAVFTYGFFGAHTAACGWAGRLGKGNKAQISALYMLFYYIGASLLGTVGGKFLSAYGWGGIVAFLTAITGAAFVLSIILSKQAVSGKTEMQLQKT